MSSADERIINRLQRIYDAQGAGGAAFSELTGEPSDNAALGSALDGKVPATRTVAGKALSSDVTLVKADVGLGSVDNTADTAKPVSTAQQTALDLKVPTSRTVNGQALSGNVVVTGLMLDTAGAPDNGVGANGDYAFDDATKTIYGPKAAGVWPAGVVLAPSGGVIGTVTFSSSGAIGAVIATGIISGVTYDALGVYLVTFASAQPDAGYIVHVNSFTGSGTVNSTSADPTSKVVGGFTVKSTRASDGSASDPDNIELSVVRLSQ